MIQINAFKLEIYDKPMLIMLNLMVVKFTRLASLHIRCIRITVSALLCHTSLATDKYAFINIKLLSIAVNVEIFARRYFHDIIVFGKCVRIKRKLHCKRLFLHVISAFLCPREICKNKNLMKMFKQV